MTDCRIAFILPIGIYLLMLGAITGDIIGSVHEFSGNDRSDFKLFVEHSSPTDDSLLTWLIAQALLKGDKNYRPYLVESVALYEKNAHRVPLSAAFGYGFAEWVREGGVENRDSYGNGSAMRVAPIAWAFDDLEDVLEHARLSALPSHSHPEGIKGALCTAACTWVARKTRDPQAVRLMAEKYYGPLPNLDVIRETHEYNETCQRCVPECMAIAVGTKDFESAIRFAASIRGDADTLGAITGSVSQALWGIPKAIRDESLAIAGRCYPGLDVTVREFEARFGAA